MGKDPDGTQPPMLWTENETNSVKLFGLKNYTPYVKDAFHRSAIDYARLCYDPVFHQAKDVASKDF